MIWLRFLLKCLFVAMFSSSKKGLKKYFSIRKRLSQLFFPIVKVFSFVSVLIIRCVGFFINLFRYIVNFLFMIYSFIVKIPVLGFVVSMPERFIRAMFFVNNTPPLFMKTDDAMVFCSKLAKEGIRYKVLSSFVVIAMMLLVVGRFSPNPSLYTIKPFVARIKLHGQIGMSSFGIEDRLPRVIDHLIKEKKVLAVIVSIDSPGGTVAASEMLYRHLLRLSEKKNTIASVKTYAASGGYLISLGCNKIFALETSEVGSIGVFRKITNVIELEKKLGLKTKLYKSSPFKAAPNMYEEITPEVDLNETVGIKETLNWFANVVKKRRGFTNAQLNIVTNAKVFSGLDSLKLGLIDGIGDEYVIMEKLVKEGVIDENTKMLDINYMPSPSSGHKIVAKLVNRVIGANVINEFETGANAGALMLQY